MKIAACFITKGDEELSSLSRAIASVSPFVDAIYLTTNGKQTELTKQFCKDNGITYSYREWSDDFSDQRNFNFAQVKEEVDFVFWMDSDDILVGGDRLREVAQIAKDNGKDVVFFTYWYGCQFNGEPSAANLKEVEMEQLRERLLKPGVTTWKKRLHETPIPVFGSKNNYTMYPYDPKERPLAIMHTSKDEDLKSKMKRNKRILELEVEEEKKLPSGNDPRTILYLMKIYAENMLSTTEELKKCIAMGHEYLDRSGWDEERATCYEQMGIAYGRLNDYKSATKMFHGALAEWPLQPLIVIRLATAYFNNKQYKFSEHWLNIAMSMDIDNKGSNLTNIKAMKMMSAELLTKLNFVYKKDTKKALESARLLMEINPSEEALQQLTTLESLDRLNDACKNVDDLAQYLADINASGSIVEVLGALPDAITAQPFAQKLRQRFQAPRRWGGNEICYFANFGSKHFEQWDSSSLESGIGGSETAVIELSKEWAKLGYKVTVYGDPLKKGVDTDGVTYLPWYYFNPRDSFNILIQWRLPALADKIKARKFLVDMHDVWNEVDFMDKLNQIDKIMVKSKTHKELSSSIPDEKLSVIGNGIRV